MLWLHFSKPLTFNVSEHLQHVSSLTHLSPPPLFFKIFFYSASKEPSASLNPVLRHICSAGIGAQISNTNVLRRFYIQKA